MYKVFVNNKRLILANSKEIIDYGNAAVVCLKKPETVNVAIRNHLLKSNTSDFIVLSADENKLIEAFEANYQVRVAAGGWVLNENNELLMIYREGHWDIPKGHLEEGETIEDCARREVEEETGISYIEMGSKIGISRHIYEHNGRMVLKVTHWFKMKTMVGTKLVPQKEEGIEKAQWINESKVKDYLQLSWNSLFEFYKEHSIH